MVKGRRNSTTRDWPTALQQLPEAEDSLVFYDGKTQFATLRGLGPFIQTVGGGDENVDRVVKILDKVWDDVAIIDYEVTVQYTEGNLNRSASYGKLLPGTETRRSARCCPAANRSRSGAPGSPPALCPTRWARA